jgi:hypothetical protein
MPPGTLVSLRIMLTSWVPLVSAPFRPVKKAATPGRPAPRPPGRRAASPEEDCRALAEGRTGTPIRSRRLRRRRSDRYVIDGLFDDLSLERRGDRLRVRRWAEDRGCPFTTELLRNGDVVLLRESFDPAVRRAVVGALLMETRVPLRPSDRRACLPGHPTPIDLASLEAWSNPPVEPPPRTPGEPERLDPW